MRQAGLYLAHQILGPRLIELTNIVNAVQHRSARQIFGDPSFAEALTKSFAGAAHRLLKASEPRSRSLRTISAIGESVDTSQSSTPVMA